MTKRPYLFLSVISHRSGTNGEFQLVDSIDRQTKNIR